MLERIDHGAVRELRLARPPANALTGELLDRLRAELATAVADGARGIVLSGAPGRFSGGIDVVDLLARDRAGFEAFFVSFYAALTALAEVPVPIVAAVTGHSPAGGAVLALCCDRRIMADGDFRIGLNEVQVGIYPGPLVHRLLERAVGARAAAHLLSTGALLGPAEALAAGYVDEVAPADQVVARARAWLDRVIALPAQAYARTRALGRADLVAMMRAVSPADVAATVEEWRAPETQATLRALVARLTGK